MIKIENKGKYEIHHPPDQLAPKVDRESGISFEEIEERAGKNLEGLVDQFLESVSESTILIKKALKTLEINQGTAVERDLIFNQSHDLKGMGGSFDYPLISLVGDKLCTLTDEDIDVVDLNLQLITAHVDIIIWSVANRVGNLEDSRSKMLLSALDNARAVA
jgi:hypothetical protein